MSLHLWFEWLVVAGIVAQALVLASLVSSGAWRRWKSLCFLAGSGLILGLVMVPILGDPGFAVFYRNGYWLGVSLMCAGRVWLAFDIARSFEGLDFLPQGLKIGMTLAAAIAGVGFTVYALVSSPHLQPGLSQLLLLERAISAGWLAIAAFLVLTCRALHFLWSTEGAKVATVTVIQIVSDVVSTHLRSYSHRTYVYAFSADSACQLACLVSLAVFFARQRGAILPDPLFRQ